jgi:surface polysaccharide O-acyltransferase-like enzyme
MIDGAQTTSLRGFYRARLNRILVPLVFWSVLYVLLLPILRKCLLGVEFGNAFEPRRILTAIFIGRPYYHLWYLYMLLGLYAATPVLNILVAHCEKTLLGGSIVVLFCLSFLTQVWEQWGGWYPFFGIKFMYYLGYFLFPYFCRTYCPVVGWRPIVPVLIVSIIVTVLGAEIGMSEFGVDPDMGPYLYSSPNVVVMSLAIFLLLRDCSPRWGEFPIVRMISDNSFGIYLIHIVPLDIIQRTRVSPGALAERIGPVAALMGVSTVIFLASFMAVACMRRFPGLRRLV